jgi:microcystin-dependent protein
MYSKTVNLGLIIILFIIMIYLYNVTNNIKKNVKNLEENNRTEGTSSETIQTVDLSNYYTKSSIDQNISELRTLITNSDVSVDETSNLFRAAGREELGFEIDLFGNLQVNSDVNFTRNVDFTESSETTFNGNLFMEHGDNSKYFDTLPPGTILSWRWNVDSSNPLPLGWALCDGQNGTPDLRGRFVLGSGEPSDNNPNTYTGDGGNSAGYTTDDNYEINQTGGKNKHTLTIPEIPSHKHLSGYYRVMDSLGWGERDNPSHGAWGSIYHRNTRSLNTDSHSSQEGRDGGFNRNSNNADPLARHPALDLDVMQDYSQPIGDRVPHNNMPPYYVLVYIMKLNRYGNNTPNNPYNSLRQSTFN